MPVEKYIEELLLRYHCVIIPGFGGLITNDRSSYINQQRQLIYPPGKSIAFNRNLSVNDGLLANYISEKEQITYSSALILIQKFVDELNKNLEEGNREEMEKLGTFHLSDDKNVQFKPELNETLSPDSYGLAPVNAVAVMREEPLEFIKQEEPVIAVKKKSKNKEKNKSKSRNKKPLTYITSAAAAIALIFVVYSYFNKPSDTNNTVILKPDSTAELFSLTEAFSYTPALPAPLIEQPVAETTKTDTVFTGSVNKKTPAVPIKNNKIETAKKSYYASGKKYQIVAGVFKSEENAIQYVEELKNKGVNASLIKINSGRKFRVIMGSYDSLPDAEIQLSEAKKINQEAWLLTL